MSRRVRVATDASLRISQKELSKFNHDIACKLRKALDCESQRHLSIQKLTDGAIEVGYGLVEAGAGLTAVDDRGTEQPVVHFQSSPSTQHHLLVAINFSWSQTAMAFRFSQAQILVFLAWGDPNVMRTVESNRRQLLRLEWEGVNDDGFFASKGAAHPHWHIDQWLAGHDRERIQANARLAQAEELREFGSNGENKTQPDVRWMRSIHLAAAAQWAAVPWALEDCSMHAKGPVDLTALGNWTFSAIRYISHQFRAAIDRAG